MNYIIILYDTVTDCLTVCPFDVNFTCDCFIDFMPFSRTHICVLGIICVPILDDAHSLQLCAHGGVRWHRIKAYKPHSHDLFGSRLFRWRRFMSITCTSR